MLKSAWLSILVAAVILLMETSSPADQLGNFADRSSENLPAWKPIEHAAVLPVAAVEVSATVPEVPASVPLPATIVRAPVTEQVAPCPTPVSETKPAFFTPFMFGDFIGPVANMFSDVKIAEGESPRPMDRAFYRFNYYNNLNKSRWTDPLERIHNVGLYQHVFGFEKTLMEGRVSIGLRVPFYTLVGSPKDDRPILDSLTGAGSAGINATEFGNISAILKAVLWEDVQTGSLISAGATVSVPTATSKAINPGQSILAYMQPYGGFILNRGDLFVQGFSSITLPVASVESIVLFNDVGIGYYVYRNNSGAGAIEAIVPTFEVHVATPLRSPTPGASIFGFTDGLLLHDVVNLTLGTTFVFTNRSTLGVGIVSPITGPKPFDFEAILQLNYRF